MAKQRFKNILMQALLDLIYNWKNQLRTEQDECVRDCNGNTFVRHE
jgi:hypothetical protein